MDLLDTVVEQNQLLQERITELENKPLSNLEEGNFREKCNTRFEIMEVTFQERSEKDKQDMDLLATVLEQSQLLQERVTALEREKENTLKCHNKQEFEKRFESIEVNINTLMKNIQDIGLAFLGVTKRN